MWPLDGGARQAMVRIGRDRVELWRADRRSAQLVEASAQDPLLQPPDVRQLQRVLTVLLDQWKRHQGVARSSFVVESAWCPVLALPAGDSLWSSRPLELLLCHRLGALYGKALTWQARVIFKPGHRLALGFGISNEVKAAMLAAARDAGIGCAGITPAMSWGWSRTGCTNGWWLWTEQDRTLISRWSGAELQAFNPAGFKDPGVGGWPAALALEAAREGIRHDASAPIFHHGWTSGDQQSRRLTEVSS